MSRTVTIRIEVLVVIAILVACVFLADFPFSISDQICPRPRPSASSLSAPSPPLFDVEFRRRWKSSPQLNSQLEPFVKKCADMFRTPRSPARADLLRLFHGGTDIFEPALSVPGSPSETAFCSRSRFPTWSRACAR
jgi:hypothetical protein